MKPEDLRKEVQKRFAVGDTIYLKLNNGQGHIGKKIKRKIIGFYPNHVLVERKGYKESYTYWDILTMASKPNMAAE